MQVYLGIDWGHYRHEAAFLNAAGAPLAQLAFPHSLEGFQRLETVRGQLGLFPADCLVALETSHQLLVDFLWDQGYGQVYMVPPHVVRGNRSRYRQSGARSDASDALLLADILRTDQGRLQP